MNKTTAELVVRSYRNGGDLWNWVQFHQFHKSELLFAFKWIDAREIEDPDAKAFALNALADSWIVTTSIYKFAVRASDYG